MSSVVLNTRVDNMVGLRLTTVDEHASEAPVRNVIPPPVPLELPNSTVLLLIVTEFPVEQLFIIFPPLKIVAVFLERCNYIVNQNITSKTVQFELDCYSSTYISNILMDFNLLFMMYTDLRTILLADVNLPPTVANTAIPPPISAFPLSK